MCVSLYRLSPNVLRLSGRLGKSVDVNCWILGCHERPRRVRRVGKNLRCLSESATSRERSIGSRRSVARAWLGVTWLSTNVSHCTPSRAPTPPATSGFICLSIHETVSGVMTWTMASRLLRGSPATMLPMSAGWRCRILSHAECPSPALSRSRTSSAMSSASSSEMACGKRAATSGPCSPRIDFPLSSILGIRVAAFYGNAVGLAGC